MGKTRAPMEIPVNAIPYARLRLRLKWTPTIAVDGVKRNPVPKPMPTPWLRKTYNRNVSLLGGSLMRRRSRCALGNIGLPGQVRA